MMRVAKSARGSALLVAVIAIALLASACNVGSDVVASETTRELGNADQSNADQSNADQSNADQSSDSVAAADPDGDTTIATAEDVTDDDPPAETTVATDTSATDAAAADVSPPAFAIDDLDCSVLDNSSGLTADGEAMFERYLDAGNRNQVPTYQLGVQVEPTTGQVAGAVRVTVPAQPREINFRVFAGLESFESGLEISNATVNGDVVDITLDRSLLSLPAATAADEAATTVELEFSYTIAKMAANGNIFAALGGDSLQPDQVGLLGRTESGMQLGHWFPVWLPTGTNADPDPSGFGDIGAFPAATICATIIVPSGYEVVTGGSRISSDETTIVEAGAGLRDFSILISDDLQLAAGIVNGVAIRVWGPAGDPESLRTVLEYAKQSQAVLHDAFGPYPWDEIDLVSAPLGSGVGGMEWPGMIWVEQSIFAGGLPGMGELGDMFGDDEALQDLLDSIGGPALSTTLEWTIAHELGHEWWHATVGNDSIESPAVDEPLAQFSACLAMEVIHPDNWREICEAQTTEQYAQARSIGIADTAAEQASDKFDSSLQYGAIVYGKAPGFYLAAADLIGWPELTAALRSFVEENPFALVSTDDLRSHLIQEAGPDGPAIGDLWDRWFRQAKGDEDIEASSIFDLFGDAEGTADLFEGLDLEGLDLEGLDLEGLDLENLDLEGLDLEGLDLGDLDIEGLDLGNLTIEELLELFEGAEN